MAGKRRHEFTEEEYLAFEDASEDRHEYIDGIILAGFHEDNPLPHSGVSIADMPRHRFTPKEYLAFERASRERHEYLDGEVYSMSGDPESHAWMMSNTLAVLHPQLSNRECRIYAGNMRVGKRSRKAYFYPDLAIVCGERAFEDSSRDTLTNPTLVIEVMSPDTEVFDRSDKLHTYYAIPSLQGYLLISPDAARVEYYWRDGERWLYQSFEGIDTTIDLAAVGCTLPLSAVYQGIEFDQSDEDED